MSLYREIVSSRVVLLWILLAILVFQIIIAYGMWQIYPRVEALEAR